MMAKGLRASAALAAALWLAPAPVRGEGPEPGPAPAEAGPAAVEPPAGAGPTGEPPAPPPQPGQAPSAGPGKPGLLDASHAAAEEQLGDLVDWLDSLFGDPRYLEFGPQLSTVRWRSEVRLTDEPRAYPHTTALVDLHLPAATAWLSRAHVVVSGDRAAEGAPADERPVTELAADQGRLELRFDLLRQPGTLFYLGGGVRFTWPPDPLVRLRLRQDLRLATSLLARLTPSAFWELRQGFGGTMQLDLDQILSRAVLVRAGGGMLLSEKSRGLEWGTSLELRAQIDARLAGALGGSMRGAERSPVAVEQYRVFARLRRDVLRRWLFAEIEPEVVWPAAPGGGYRTVLGVILRLEVLFVSESRAPEPAAPAPAAAPPEARPPDVPWP
ncbi:MAG TPA: hypothetical protein VIV59_07805 [Anaeromyxobacteraceae bacterium]